MAISRPQIKLYKNWESTWANLPKLAQFELGYKQEDIEWINIELLKGGNFDTEFLVVNPNGTLPALQVDGKNFIDSIFDPWFLISELDTSLANSARRIRAAASPAPIPAVDNALMALPAKLGGLGILSFKRGAPLAFAAASEAADTLLAPLLDQDIDAASQTVLSRRERCQEAF
ncbi:hypothetical protein EHS25_003958 [Saitozyma podzolica]|uniref:GST N-terminal domain-containing protein n=1 Tax=Saitozyma podzolica TaxID=1890683 RepID=A0A427YT41_9TREE|nr:hypothetical protein EHS25_003958 [Saitozyma podzolica]